MYCNAIATRLFVGMLTPAMRAMILAPLAGPNVRPMSAVAAVRPKPIPRHDSSQAMPQTCGCSGSDHERSRDRPIEPSSDAREYDADAVPLYPGPSIA